MILKLTDHQKTLIEKHGQLMERFGLPPIASRINALLTVIDEPFLTFSQIQTILQISKSARSAALNILSLKGYVNFRTVLGDRKRYFYAEIESWKLKLTKDFEVLEELGGVIGDIAQSKSEKDILLKKDVAEHSDFLIHLGSSTILSLKTSIPR